MFSVETADGRVLSPENARLLSLSAPHPEQVAQRATVAGFKQWQKHGRAVKKGEKGTLIFIPRHKKKGKEPVEPDPTEPAEPADPADPAEPQKQKMRYTKNYVFFFSQTEPLEASQERRAKAKAEPAEPPPPAQPAQPAPAEPPPPPPAPPAPPAQPASIASRIASFTF